MSGLPDAEAVVELLEERLLGESTRPLPAAGYGLATLPDLGELFIRTPEGRHFKVTVEEMSADDVEGCGVDFD